MIKIDCCFQQRLFVKIKNVIVTVENEVSENGMKINFYGYNILYLTRRIYRAPNLICSCVGAYHYNYTRLLERPDLCVPAIFPIRYPVSLFFDFCSLSF